MGVNKRRWGQAMSVLLYAASEKGPGERLRGIIKTFVPEREIEVLGTIHSLSDRLRRPTDAVDVAILLAANRDELGEFLSVNDFLSDLRIILILPDRGEDTVAKGHTLRPRFLSYADSNFTDVAAVLGKMLSGNSTS
jgi:hypothetical protein